MEQCAWFYNFVSITNVILQRFLYKLHTKVAANPN